MTSTDNDCFFDTVIEEIQRNRWPHACEENSIEHYGKLTFYDAVSIPDSTQAETACKILLGRALRDIDEVEPDTGFTAILIAAKLGRLNLMKLLLYDKLHPATLHVLGARCGSTVLHCALESWNLDLIRFLLPLSLGENLLVQDCDGANILHTACSQGFPDAAELIVDTLMRLERRYHGCSLMERMCVQSDASGQTFLHYAAAETGHGFEAVVRKVFSQVSDERGRELLQRRTAKGETISFSCRNVELLRQLAVTHQLLQLDMDGDRVLNIDGRSALHERAAQGDIETLRFWIHRSSTSTERQKQLMSLDNKNRTVLHAAVESGNVWCLVECFTHFPTTGTNPNGDAVLSPLLPSMMGIVDQPFKTEGSLTQSGPPTDAMYETVGPPCEDSKGEPIDVAEKREPTAVPHELSNGELSPSPHVPSGEEKLSSSDQCVELSHSVLVQEYLQSLGHVMAGDEQGNTILHTAAKLGFVQCVRVIIDVLLSVLPIGPIVPDEKHLALEVRYLDAFWDVYFSRFYNTGGFTPLFFACYSDKEDLTLELLRPVSVLIARYVNDIERAAAQCVEHLLAIQKITCEIGDGELETTQVLKDSGSNAPSRNESRAASPHGSMMRSKSQSDRNRSPEVASPGRATAVEASVDSELLRRSGANAVLSDIASQPPLRRVGTASEQSLLSSPYGSLRGLGVTQILMNTTGLFSGSMSLGGSLSLQGKQQGSSSGENGSRTRVPPPTSVLPTDSSIVKFGGMLIMKFVDQRHGTQQRMTPLHFACSCGARKCIGVLMKHQAPTHVREVRKLGLSSALTVPDNSYATPLLICVQRGDVVACEQLLLKAPSLSCVVEMVRGAIEGCEAATKMSFRLLCLQHCLRTPLTAQNMTVEVRSPTITVSEVEDQPAIRPLSPTSSFGGRYGKGKDRLASTLSGESWETLDSTANGNFAHTIGDVFLFSPRIAAAITEEEEEYQGDSDGENRRTAQKHPPMTTKPTTTKSSSPTDDNESLAASMQLLTASIKAPMCVSVEIGGENNDDETMVPMLRNGVALPGTVPELLDVDDEDAMQHAAAFLQFVLSQLSEPCCDNEQCRCRALMECVSENAIMATQSITGTHSFLVGQFKLIRERQDYQRRAEAAKYLVTEMDPAKAIQRTFPYADLKHPNPKLTDMDINVKRRDDYLSRQEFLSVMEVSKEAFSHWPAKKKETKKTSVGLQP